MVISVKDYNFYLSFPSLFLELHAKWHEKQKSGSSEAKCRGVQGQKGARANPKWRRHSKLNEKPSHLRNFMFMQFFKAGSSRKRLNGA